MAKAVKQAVKPTVEKSQDETIGNETMIIIGTGFGGLVDGVKYQYPTEAANHLVSAGHAKLKTKE